MKKPQAYMPAVFSLYNKNKSLFTLNSHKPKAMKKLACMLVVALTSACAFSQERTDVIPNEVDSNNFYYFVSVSYIFPDSRENEFQKSRLRSDAIRGNRLSKAEIEMVLFPSKKYGGEIHPHLILRVDAIPSSYLSSRFGFGITSKSLGSSLGFFYGTYYRRVPYEANFITRRKRSFENYGLWGFYLQSLSDDASFAFSMAFEKTHTFISARVGWNVGQYLTSSELEIGLSTLEAVLSYESLSGAGGGFAIRPFARARIELFRVVPDKADVTEQARLQTKLSPNFKFRLAYYVD